MAKSSGNMLGKWAFLIGVILAIVLGLFGALTQGMIVTLVILGLIVGLLNVGSKETTPFLLAGAVLIIASSLGQDVVSSVVLFERVLEAVLALFVPATIIVAIKHVFSLSRN